MVERGFASFADWLADGDELEPDDADEGDRDDADLDDEDDFEPTEAMWQRLREIERDLGLVPTRRGPDEQEEGSE